MPFSAKNLRVLIPCEPVTELPCEVTHPGPGPDPPAPEGCSPSNHTAYWVPPPVILVDPADLDLLKEQLEARLKEIELAQQRLKDKG